MRGVKSSVKCVAELQLYLRNQAITILTWLDTASSVVATLKGCTTNKFMAYNR